MNRLASASVCLLFPVVAGACYRYVPAVTPEPGRLIRAELNDQGSTAITSTLGPGVREIDGLLLATEGQELSVLLDSYVTRLQGTLSGGNQPIRLPTGHVTMMLERRVDPVRSVILGVALASGAFTMVKLFGPGGLVFSDEEEEDPGPVQIVVPRPRAGPFVLRLAWPPKLP
jgi:hypothetical protein